MKQALIRARDRADTKVSALAALIIGGALALSTQAQAQTGTSGTVDLTQDTSGGKKLSDVTANITTGSQNIAAMIIAIVAVLGFVIVALSLVQMHKASKDERESPKAAVVGLFIGGAMAGVGSIMWIMKNTILG